MCNLVLNVAHFPTWCVMFWVVLLNLDSNREKKKTTRKNTSLTIKQAHNLMKIFKHTGLHFLNPIIIRMLFPCWLASSHAFARFCTFPSPLRRNYGWMLLLITFFLEQSKVALFLYPSHQEVDKAEMLISILSLRAHWVSSGTTEPRKAWLQHKHDYNCGNN